jgi:RNA polymerase sigma factor for flagellar operon FliA
MPAPALDTSARADPALWARWRSGDPRAGDHLVRHYAPWVRRVARSVFVRVRGRGDDWPDYVQNATVGMLEALRAFDVERGVPFELFAGPRVRGAVFNGLRDLRSTGAGPSGTASFEAVESLRDTEDADPVDRFIAMVSSLAAGHVMGLYAEHEPADEAGPYHVVVRSQLGERLSRQLRRLGERERTVLEWHYIQHLSFVQIAETLGVTKGRVSQLHRQALARMREWLGHDQWQHAL